MSQTYNKLAKIIKDNFRFSTLNFIFILIYINLFQLILGADNTIVGVIFVILMSASMVRDLTATPIKHLLIQAGVLVWMAAAAYLVNVLPAPFSFFLNFITLFMILYAFTYEYSSHIYFPYILSYLFLLFIAPVTAARFPVRIAAMLVGAVSIMLYQWVMGRRRIVETSKDVLSEMIEDVRAAVDNKMVQSDIRPDLGRMHRQLTLLCRTVYDRRKKTLCISDGGFSLIAAGRGLEQLLILIDELPKEVSGHELDYLPNVARQLEDYSSFLQGKLKDLPPFEIYDSFDEDNKKAFELFQKTMCYIRDRLLHMADPRKKIHYRKTAMSFKVRLLAAVDFSPLRAIYAVRVALLLSAATLIVQLLGLSHGKWLLFTIASVSLPYADDVPLKMKKRFLATMSGCLFSLVLYSLIPSTAGRTVIMMLSGYLSFYFRDYTQTFACSTVGALGAAVFMNAFGFKAVGGFILIRAAYIVAGVIIAYAANCLLLPYRRAAATGQLWRKYQKMTDLLACTCSSDKLDPQLYYSLVIQAHLLEEKLTQNAHLEDWEDYPKTLKQCREKVHLAHRHFIAGRADAPLFEPGHLI